MYKLFFIARNNIKKQKGDMITFFVLTLFAAFLIFDAVSAVLGTGKVLDEAFTETKGADMMLITGASGKGGGYRLSRKPEKYTIGEILELMEGSLSPVACIADKKYKCNRKKK